MRRPTTELSALDPWTAHEREQVLHVARTTTPLQRLQWASGMLRRFHDQIIRESESEWRERLKQWNRD